MQLNGILSKIMDNYLCLRGIASIKKLAEISEINPDIQRDLLEEHKNEMKDFLEKGEYAFFPEVVLSMDIGLPDNNEEFEKLAGAADSASDGFYNKVGKIKVNFKSDNNKFIDDYRQLKVAQLTFDEEDVKVSRIDGNHRLSAANYLTNDILIPFCLIIFANREEAQNHSRAVFHNINSKQIPLKLEQNIKIIIESSDVFADSMLEQSQPFGLHYKLTRELLCGNAKIDFACFPHIKNFVHDNKYSFFTNLFKYLLQKEFIKGDKAVNDVKKELVKIENALVEAGIDTSTKSNSAVLGALAYYKLSDQKKYDYFIKWIAKNHIADAKTVNVDDIINIFDQVYDNIPKKVFLARWYPASDNNQHEKAKHRLDAIKKVAENLHLELIDLGTKEGGTYDIRSVMYKEIRDCDIFIADLTGCRHNVMVEVGYALSLGLARMLFYFSPTDKYSEPPFDINGFRYEPINDSREIETKIKPLIESILSEIN